MAKFAYNATGKAGNPVTGSLEAADVQAARWMLLERGLKPDSVTEQSADDGGSATPGWAWLNPAYWGRVKSVQIELSLAAASRSWRRSRPSSSNRPPAQQDACLCASGTASKPAAPSRTR